MISLRNTMRGQETRKILVADDHALCRELLVAFLQQFGYETVSVGNGRDAVFAVGREPFDLALMDIEMPVMDGLRAAALIRAGEEAGHRLPMIAMSGHTSEEFRGRVLAAGFDGFLPKPIDFEAFGESISARLGWKLQRGGPNG
jgi:CheY-like chemotaxis protein